MDDWGDPWADDATTPGVAKYEAIPYNAASVGSGTLPPWQDDAQWGHDNTVGDWGDFQESWEPSVQKSGESALTEREDTVYNGPVDEDDNEVPARNAQEQEVNETENTTNTSLGHDRVSGFAERTSAATMTSGASDFLSYEGHRKETGDATVTSVDSSSDGTIHVEIGQTLVTEKAAEDDVSTRTSTSPSVETQSPVAFHGTPRTSSEEDRAHGMAGAYLRMPPDPKTSTLANILTDDLKAAAIVGGSEEGQEAETTLTTPERHALHDPSSLPKDLSEPSPQESTPVEPVVRPDVASFHPNLRLLSELLPPMKREQDFEVVEATALSSTSSKQAWYRLTREETLREFNAGSADTNYIRVTWQNSKARADVNKIVSRWMIEDRATGKASFGNRPSAMFGWDQPVAKQSSTARPPVQVGTVRSSTDATRRGPTSSPKVASPSFGWSSASPWNDQEPTAIDERLSVEKNADQLPSTTPTQNRLIANLTKDNVRPMSADFSTTSFQFGHKKNTRSVSKLAVPDSRPSIDALMHSAAQKNLDISPMVPNAAAADGSSQRRPSVKPDNIIIPQPSLWHAEGMQRHTPASARPSSTQLEMQAVTEEDEWGDMVQTPTRFAPLSAAASTSPTKAAAVPMEPQPSQDALTTIPSEGARSRRQNSFDTFKPTQPTHFSPQTLQAPLDPWSSADFSVFDPIQPPSSSSSPERTSASWTQQSHFSTSAAEEDGLTQVHLPLPKSTTLVQTKGLQNDDLVRDIISQLPDLSYMLE